MWVVGTEVETEAKVKVCNWAGLRDLHLVAVGDQGFGFWVGEFGKKSGRIVSVVHAGGTRGANLS